MLNATAVNQNHNHFSAEVRLELRAEGRAFELASIGPHDVTPRAPMDLPPCIGEIVMAVNGELVRWAVQLPNGAVPFDRIVQADTIEG